MRPTRWGTLLILLLVFGVLSYAGLRAWTGAGHLVSATPWAVTVVLVVIAVVVFMAALPVRRWNQGRRTAPLDPLRASRIVVMGKTASHGGAILLGWYLAQVVLVVTRLDVDAILQRALLAALAAAGCILVVAAGLLAERFCRLPPEHDDPNQGGR